MTVSIFTAAPRRGKTEYAVQLARKTAATSLTGVRVCVPTSLQAAAFRRRLADAGGTFGVHVLSYDALVNQVLDASGESYTEIDRLVQFHLLRTLIEQADLSHYASLRDKPGFAVIMQDLIAELKSGEIYPETFFAAVQDLGGDPRLGELALLYSDYQERLLANEWADRVGLSWLAAEALQGRAPDKTPNWPLLIVDGFEGFTPIQLTLFRHLSDRVGELVVLLPQVDQAHFYRYERARQHTEAALGVTAVPLPQPSAEPSSRQPALEHLAKNLFAAGRSEKVAAGSTIVLREAVGPADEVRTALRWLKQQIVDHDLEAGQVALLARRIESFQPFIRQIAAEFGMPLQWVDGQPLAHNPVIAALLELMRLHLPGGQNLARRSMVAAWRSPYFRWDSAGALDSSAAADLLDLLARQQRVIGGLDQWESAFEAALAAARAKPDEAVADEEALGATDRLDLSGLERLQGRFAAFMALTQPLPEATVAGHVRWLEQIIGPDPQIEGSLLSEDQSLHVVAQARLNKDTTGDDMAALRQLKEVLRGLVWTDVALGKIGTLDYAAFFEELQSAVRLATFTPPDQDGRSGIVTGNTVQVRGLGLAAVAILGLGEGSFPQTIVEDPFLRDQDRQQLRDQANFLLEPSTQNSEREFFHEAVTRPDRALLLTRSLLADNGAEWEASPFWEEVQKLVEVALQRISSATPPAPEEAASLAEWWESLAAQGQSRAAADLNPDTWQAIETAAAIWQARQDGRPSPFDGDLGTLAEELGAQFGPETTWSASRLEAYQTCGFLFFLQNVLDLQARPEPAEGLDARQLGSVYHQIFEEVTVAGPLDSGDEAAVRAAVVAIANPILDAAPEKQGFRTTAWWPQTRQEVIDNVVATLIALDDGEFKFHEAEAKFGLYGMEPLVIERENGRLRLRGLIDRVDRDDQGRIRIVDYKLGGKASFGKPQFAQGKRLQLPLYALAARDALKLGEVADGFYWHIQQADKSGFQMSSADGGVEGAMATAVAHAFDAISKIQAGAFQPRPPSGGCPEYCPAAAFCWQYTPRGW